MDSLLGTENLVALLSLTTLEIVLGIDNVIFIALLAARLPRHRQDLARRLGIGLAVVSRLALLLSLGWLLNLTRPLFSVAGHVVSGKDLVLIAGGLFLIAKSTFEIHDKLEGAAEGELQGAGRKAATMAGVLAQIVLVDMVFSIDSVITAVGMSRNLAVISIAVVVAAVVMLVFSGAVSRFVQRHPSMKILALAFLILIGVMLVAEGSGRHIERGYIYFAMAFSFLVELLNLRLRARSAPVALRRTALPAAEE